MDKVKELFSKLLDFIKTRWLGFWFLIAVAVFSIIHAFVYLGGFGSTNYFGGWAFALPLVTVLGVVALFFKPTEKYAAVVMYALSFASLLTFLKAAYMHLTTAFFGGISGNILVQAGFTFSFCTIACVVNMILCIAAMFLKTSRETKKEKNSENCETDDEVKEAGV